MIYICIPTHNEQQTVGVVLWKLRQVLTEFPRDYQLLVVDDASTDRTMEVLEPYTRVLPLTVIRSERQIGQAASLEMLLREALRRSEYPKRDIVITLQADFSEDPDDIVPMIKRIEAGVDLVLGNKVSASRPGRAWRMARALGNFFVRAQKWPEGVSSPFESYRAYRLYAIKRAVEDGSGRRLMHFDGWAGQAELLRAVLPHARRIEAIDVEHRADRLQRPRRERPFAAAFQVRSMASGAAPNGLLGVTELDAMAQTASRTRDRAPLAPRPAAERAAQERTNGRASRPRSAGDGKRRRDGADTSRRGPARPAAAEPPVSRPPAKPGNARTEQTPARAGADQNAKGTPRPADPTARPPRPKRAPTSKPATQQRAATAPASPAAPASATVPESATEPKSADASPIGPPSTAETEPNSMTSQVAADDAAAAQREVEQPVKRRRRRRKRGKGSTASSAEKPQSADVVAADPSSTEAEGAGDSERNDAAEGSSESGERKRRRRRGGRGRRRGGKTHQPNAQESGDSGGGDADTARDTPAAFSAGAAAPPANPSED